MSALLRVGLSLLDHGYSVVPKRHRSKVPHIREAGRFNKRQPTARELKKWFKSWPDAGLSLAAGSRFGYVIVDFDCLNREISKKCLIHLRKLVGSKFPTRVGRAPKWAALLGVRHHVVTAKFERHNLEIFGDRMDIMAFGIHEDTGEPYVWTDGSPADTPVAQLPQITPDALERFVQLVSFENPGSKGSQGRSKRRKGGKASQRADFDYETLSEQRRGLRGEEYSKVIEQQLAALEDGNRSNTLISVVGSLVRRGFRDAQILSVLDQPYLQRCGVDWTEPTRAEALKQVTDMIKRARAHQGARHV